MNSEVSSCPPRKHISSRRESPGASPDPPERLGLRSCHQRLQWAPAAIQRTTPPCSYPVLRSEPRWPQRSATGGCQEACGYFLLGLQVQPHLWGTETALQGAGTELGELRCCCRRSPNDPPGSRPRPPAPALRRCCALRAAHGNPGQSPKLPTRPRPPLPQGCPGTG